MKKSIEQAIKQFTRNFNIFEQKHTDTFIYTLLLNRPIHQKILTKLLPITDSLICADGGANRIIQIQKQISQPLIKSALIPKYIVGDMDSVEKSTLEYFTALGTQVVNMPEQDHSDIEKSLSFILSLIDTVKQDKRQLIIVLGAFGGRMDHTINNISILKKISEQYKQQIQDSKFDIMTLDRHSSMIYLPSGHNNVKLSPGFHSKYGVGLISFSDNETHVETDGLRWNIGEKYQTKYLKFGSAESSSNELLSYDISIQCDQGLFLANSILLTDKEYN